MGLDEYIISLDPASSKPPDSLDDLDGILVSPPISSEGLEGPSEWVGDSMIDATSPLMFSTNGLQSIAAGTAAFTDAAQDPSSSLLIAAPSLVVENRTPESNLREDDRSVDLTARSGWNFESGTTGVARMLGEFLAKVGPIEAAVIPPKDVDSFQDDVALQIPQLMAAGLGPVDTSTTDTGVQGRGSAVPPALASSPPLWYDSAVTSPGPVGIFTGDTNGSASGGDDSVERMEGRLSQIAERLERAIERLASPTPPLGSRPRMFRGRIDG